MKRIKKLISTIVAATFLSTMAVPVAFAADVDDSITRLNGLGVLTGYADGDFKADQNITRAEYAAIAVRLLGLESAASAAKGGTKFKDVTSAHWATGYINLAIGNGIIKGYTDGTFKPDANVTNAEAVAMLVRVLGYDPVVTGTWPTNYVGKAAQVGVLDGVSVSDYNAAATRGNVFLAADNSLDAKIMKQVAFGSEPKWEETKETLKEAKLKVKKIEDVQVTDLAFLDDSLDADEIRLNFPVDTDDVDYPSDGKYEIKSKQNVADMFGMTVDVWMKDDEVVFLENAEDEVFTDVIKSVDTTANTIKLKDKDKTYDYDPAQISENFGSFGANEAALYAGMTVKVVVDADDKDALQSVIAYDFDGASGVVESVDATDRVIDFEDGSITLDENYLVVRNGSAVKVSELKKGDVVYYVDNYVLATDASVTGKLTNAYKGTDLTTNGAADANLKLVVGGKTVYTAPGAKYSTNGGDTYEDIIGVGDNYADGLDNIDQIKNKEVVVKCDAFGKVAFISAGSANSSATPDGYFNAVVRYFDNDASGVGVSGKNYIMAAKEDGTEVYYELNDDTTINGKDAIDELAALGNETNWTFAQEAVGGKVVAAGNIVKISLTADGKVDNIQTYTENSDLKTAVDDVDFNATSGVLDVAGGLLVTSETKIVKVKEVASGVIDEVEAISWSSVKNQYDAADTITDPITVVYKDGKAKVIFINTAVDFSTDFMYGVVVGESTDGYSVLTKDGVKELEATKVDDVANKDLIQYKLKAGEDKIDGAALEMPTLNSKLYKVKSALETFDGAYRLQVVEWDDAEDVEVGTKFYVYIDKGNAVFYDYEESKVATSVSTGKIVKLVDVLDDDSDYKVGGDSNYDFVVIVD